MTATAEFYEERADEAAAEAEAATLQNVRDRALRSEGAWRGMADRAKKITHERELAAQARATKQEDVEA